MSGDRRSSCATFGRLEAQKDGPYVVFKGRNQLTARVKKKRLQAKRTEDAARRRERDSIPETHMEMGVNKKAKRARGRTGGTRGPEWTHAKGIKRKLMH